MFRQRLPCEGALAAAQGLLQSSSCQALLETTQRIAVPREPAIGTGLAGQRLLVSQAQPARAWAQKDESPSYGFAASATFHSRDPNGDKVAALQQVAGTELYKIKIVTGALRGAGTHSRAVVQLIGTNGVSPRVVVGGNEEGFPRGSTRSVPIVVPHGHLGTLRRVLIQKEDDGQELGGGWYLKHVEVQQPSGDHTLFPCESWLGDNDSGTYFGALERNLLPAVPSLTAEKPSPVKIQASGIAIPHPEKVIKSKLKGYNTKGYGYGGEDAYFFAQNNTGLFGMGVADGVYMWREHGIDSGLFSRSLMEFCKQQIEKGKEDVIAILDDAVNKVQKDSIQGSTTLCMLTVNQHTGQLKSANLGDSGFLVFSVSHGFGYDLKYRTNQLEHSFGCPYQLGHHANANKIEDSEFSSLTVNSGDVIVMGSDGLLDNLADMDMAKEISDMMRKGMRCSEMTQRITKLAFDNSLDRKKVTPYSQGASEAFDMVYSGGKPDDITVMVAVCQ